jgi:hypothetical protein
MFSNYERSRKPESQPRPDFKFFPLYCHHDIRYDIKNPSIQSANIASPTKPYVIC